MANPYSVVFDFEDRVADWAGSKYAVAVESGTAAIFLSLMYRRPLDVVGIPSRTYPSVPCSIIHAGGRVAWHDEPWEGAYELIGAGVTDSALRFRPGMYTEGLYCLSFHVKKHLPIGRGGMILTNDIAARDWLRLARFDGRSPVPLKDDHFTMLGWNMYMEPALAARGIQLFEVAKTRSDFVDLAVDAQGYPDLSQYEIYNR